MKKLLALLFALLAAPVGAQVIPSGPVGSLNYWGVGGLSQVLNPGLAGQCLTTQGTGSAPVWVNCQVSSLALLPPINTNQFYGNVSGQFLPPVGVDVNAILNTVGYDIARPPPVESIIYKSNVGPLFNWQALFPGTAGSLLTSGGPTNPPFWATNQIQANLSGICTTIGAVLYFDTPSLQWKCLAPGTSGQVLQTGGAGANPSYLALSGTAPITYSIGAIGCATCATTTNGGPLSAVSPLSISAAGAISIPNPLPIANGGTGQGTQTTAFNALAPTPTRAGDITFWNGSNYVNLAGNNSGTQVLQETSAGVPSWVTAGSGTVTSVTCGTGLSGGTFTTSGTCAVSLTTATNSLGADVTLSSTTTFFDGPSMAQGTTGTWFASGQAVLQDTAGASLFFCKLWDGTTVFDSAAVNSTGANGLAVIHLSGFLASPAANIRISCEDNAATTGKIRFNASGLSKDSTISGFRIQ